MVETVYVCNSKTDLSHFFKESEGHTVDHLKQHFPGIDARLFGYDFERQWGSRKPEENAVLFVDKRSMEVFVYDYYDDIEFGYSGLRMGRGDQKDLVSAFVNREMGVLKEVVGVQVSRILRPVGPLVIVVNTGELSHKMQPTVRQYVRLVRACAPMTTRVRVVKEECHPELYRLTSDAWKESLEPEPAEEPWRQSLDDDFIFDGPAGI